MENDGTSKPNSFSKKLNLYKDKHHAVRRLAN